MNEPIDAGAQVLVSIYQSMKELHRTLYDQAFKIQAFELTMKSFDQTRPVYESALEQVKTPEYDEERRKSLLAYDVLIELARGGPRHSA